MNDEPIVICGAGIAGVAAAYFLSCHHHCSNVTLIEAGNPLSLTSDKSTEAYRNWWPGPDGAMTAYMNRSIDLMQELAAKTNNRFNMSRHGYLFASADASKKEWLHNLASTAADHGAGPVRVHDSASATYSRSGESQYDNPALTGADLITDPAIIAREFPYLNPDTVVLAHARRAGWLSAQQLGMTMLEAARESGVKLVHGQLTDIDVASGQVQSVRVRTQDQTQSVSAQSLIICAGPMLAEIAAMVGIELPVVAERHLKISFADKQQVVARNAPMSIWLDSQQLPWREDERSALAEESENQWLLDEFPAGVHCRPDGVGSSQTVLALFNYENKGEPVVFPLRDEPHYPEIVLRGLSTMIPALSTYIDSGVRPYMDGGYYMRTRENRPLVGPLSIPGLYVSAAYSGFGIMASCAGGDLIARHVVQAELPEYAPAFMLSRYDDSDYCARIDAAGEDGQI
jgi:glycine/D-amino acid oxidase-like deaminating enzyme